MVVFKFEDAIDYLESTINLDTKPEEKHHLFLSYKEGDDDIRISSKNGDKSVDLSSKQSISARDGTGKEIVFDTPMKGDVIGTYKMNITSGQEYFIWFAKFLFKIKETVDGLTSVVMGIGSNDPRNGKKYYTGYLEDTPMGLNIQIIEEEGKTYAIIEEVIPSTRS